MDERGMWVLNMQILLPCSVIGLLLMYIGHLGQEAKQDCAWLVLGCKISSKLWEESGSRKDIPGAEHTYDFVLLLKKKYLDISESS